MLIGKKRASSSDEVWHNQPQAKMKVSDRDYSGKEVFVGIDVHKKTYAIAVTCERKIVKKWSSPASPDSLAAQLQR